MDILGMLRLHSGPRLEKEEGEEEEWAILVGLRVVVVVGLR